uniref:NXPE family member 3-like n=1 Tax=Saccoglossus kowalevskii TaxID=10224 RepID=A0ABM0N165_SACKO|nr:PREDICTED: NXPE family member 3-like [Saccoglossus kowalevskii]
MRIRRLFRTRSLCIKYICGCLLLSKVYHFMIGFILGAVITQLFVGKVNDDFRWTTAREVNEEVTCDMQMNMSVRLDQMVTRLLPRLLNDDNARFMGDTSEVTSPFTTRLTLFQNAEKQATVKQGDFVHVVIETFDSNGRRRQSGGDFFFAVMSNSLMWKSTTGRVVDYHNGTYSVYFFAGWQGNAYVYVTLVHPAQAIRWIEHVYRPRGHSVNWVGIFHNHVGRETSMCYVTRGTQDNMCEYRNFNALGDTGPSKDATMTDSRATFILNNLPTCGPDIPMQLSDGWWESDSTWTSLVCKTKRWTIEQMQKCLTGKTVYILGDSTVRIWHETLTWLIGLKSAGDQIRRFWTSTEYNITLIFEFNAVITGTIPISFWNQKFEADMIDKIKHCNAIVVLSLTYHYASWTGRSYIERLLHVRDAVIRLVERCPDSMVVIKSSHPRDHPNSQSYIHSSDWTLFDMNRISRAIFAGIGVRFVDVWDMSLAHFSTNHVHPTDNVVRQQLDLFFSFSCPTYF